MVGTGKIDGYGIRHLPPTMSNAGGGLAFTTTLQHAAAGRDGTAATPGPEQMHRIIDCLQALRQDPADGRNGDIVHRTMVKFEMKTYLNNQKRGVENVPSAALRKKDAARRETAFMKEAKRALIAVERNLPVIQDPVYRAKIIAALKGIG